MFFPLTLLLLCGSTTLYAMNNPFESKLPFKEGVVHYIITGNAQGTRTTYIKDFGKRRLIYQKSSSKIMHKGHDNDTLIMMDENWTYHINLTTNEAIKEPSLNKILINKFNALSKEEQQIIHAQKSKVILSYPCIEESVDGTHRFVTKEGHLMLTMDKRIMGYHENITATLIEKKDINESLFKLPKKLKIKEKKADLKRAQNIIDALLEKKNDKKENLKADYHRIIQEGIRSLDF